MTSNKVDLTTDFANLSATEITQIKTELQSTRDGYQNQGAGQRIPYLPNYSGDSGIELQYYLSAIESVQLNHSPQQVAQAIRKTVTGTALKVISILDYSSSASDLVAELKKNFKKVTDTASAWQKFYSASQTSRESTIEWRTRVQDLYRKTGNTTDDDLHLKTKLYSGLHSTKLREHVLWKYDDDNTTEEQLYTVLRKLTDKTLPLMSAPMQSSEDTLRKEVEELRTQVTNLLSKDNTKRKNDTGIDKMESVHQPPPIDQCQLSPKRMYSV